MNKKIKIGIIGANPDRGWASLAHIPALEKLPDYTITAASAKRQEDISKLKNVFSIPHVYETVDELVASPEVDMVLVAVKVPQHFNLIKKVAVAGKDIISEWPLGRNLQEAKEIAALATKHNVKGYIGLQSRSIPAVRFVKDYIAQGNIGEVLSTSMIGSGIIFGEFTEKAMEYTVTPENGAGMLPVAFGNTADALTYVLGEFSELSATTAIRRKTTRIIETGDDIEVKTPDQVVVSGILESGAVASIHYRGGHLPGTNFFWEINGTQGAIQISASGGSLAVFDVTVKASTGENQTMEILDIPEEYNLIKDNPLELIPTNVAQNYQLLLQENAPTFADAIIRHRMIAAIEKSASTGTKQSYTIHKE